MISMTRNERKRYSDDNPHDFDLWCDETMHYQLDDETWRDPDSMYMEREEVDEWYISDDEWWNNKAEQLKLDI